MLPLLLLGAAVAASAFLSVMAKQPTRVFGLLAGWSCLQTVALALIFVPLLGTQGALVALVKEGLVFIALVFIGLRKDRLRGGLPPTVLIAGSAFLFVVALYFLLPLEAAYSGVPRSGLNARLGGAREWATPGLLMVFGSALYRAGLSSATLRINLVRLGNLVAATALVAYVVIPVATWANWDAIVTGADSTTSDTGGLVSYFLGVGIPRAVAPFGSPLALAFFLVLPFLLALRVPGRGRTVSLSLIGVTLTLTQTRGILAGLLLVAFLSSAPVFLRLLTTLAIGYEALTFFAANYVGNGLYTSRDPSTVAHVKALHDALATFTHYPFGVGLGQGGAIGRFQGQGRAGGESLPLVLGNELGWVGLALFLLFFLTTIRRLGRSVTDAATPHDALLTRCTRDALAVYAIASLTTEHAVAFSSSWLVWATTGFLLAKGRGQDRRSVSSPSKGFERAPDLPASRSRHHPLEPAGVGRASGRQRADITGDLASSSRR